jgi:hypothetical protein
MVLPTTANGQSPAGHRPDVALRTGVLPGTRCVDGSSMQKAEGSPPKKSFARLLGEAAAAVSRLVGRVTHRS